MAKQKNIFEIIPPLRQMTKKEMKQLDNLFKAVETGNVRYVK